MRQRKRLKRLMLDIEPRNIQGGKKDEEINQRIKGLCSENSEENYGPETPEKNG
jgi:hypothetical protein